MSLSCTDCFPDLLCCEDAGILSHDLPEYYSADPDQFSEDIDEVVSGFIDEEGDYVPGLHYLESHSFDASAREGSIAWMLKVHAFFCFQPLTAYLSVNYMDRFLSCSRFSQSNGWALQLLAVACLSLAAKMEEPLVPSLYHIQVGGAKFIFQPRTIRRMELLVLNALDWRLRSITPFHFINFFANKVDSTGKFTSLLVSRAAEIILIIMKDANFLRYWPSTIALVSILCATNEIPNLTRLYPENAMAWCDGLSQDKVFTCYKLMQEALGDNIPKTPPPVLPRKRVGSVSELSSFSSSSSSPSPIKRRKLNKWLWGDEEEYKS